MSESTDLEAGEPRADVTDALWCMECGYRRRTSSGQTRTKCPHGHGDLVQARLLTLEEFSKIVPHPTLAPSEPAPDGGLRELLKAVDDLCFECDGVLQTKAPSRETYNRAYLVIKAMKDMLGGAALRQGAKERLREEVRTVLKRIEGLSKALTDRHPSIAKEVRDLPLGLGEIAALRQGAKEQG